MKKYVYAFCLLLACKATIADDLTFNVTNTTSGFSTGAIDMNVSGGVAPFTYSWSGPGGFSANTEDVSGLATGTYTITVTDAYCGVATTTVFVDATTGINETITGSCFRAFPNPAKEQVTLLCDETLNGANVKLTNMEGKVLSNKQGISGNNVVLDLSGVASGIYFIELTNNGKTSRKKIVKE